MNSPDFYPALNRTPGLAATSLERLIWVRHIGILLPGHDLSRVIGFSGLGLP
jgi:hypothetical protein